MTQTAYNSLLLEKLHAEQRWENQLAQDWTVADLDEEEIRLTATEAIAAGRLADPGRRDPHDLLRGLNLL